MTAYTKVTRNGQITLPANVRKKLGVVEGDIIEIEVSEESAVLVPKKLVDKSQAYFWTQRWQDGEKRSENDIRSGRVKIFNSADELFKELEQD